MKYLVVFVCFTLLLQAAASHGSRIINGQDATQGQFPWQVGITTVTQNTQQFCTGAIISQEWVLTAAHCVNGADTIGVYSGVVNLSSSDRILTTTTYYIVHEDFESTVLRNDIGLIHLNPSLVFDDNTSAIKLSEDELLPGTEVIISGWGHSTHDDTSNSTNILQYAIVTTIANSNCEQIYGTNYVFPNVVCAIGTQPIKNPCSGDGGAPLVANLDNDPIHVGVFSFISSLGCDVEYPAGYTRTGSFRGWIRARAGV